MSVARISFKRQTTFTQGLKCSHLTIMRQSLCWSVTIKLIGAYSQMRCYFQPNLTTLWPIIWVQRSPLWVNTIVRLLFCFFSPSTLNLNKCTLPGQNLAAAIPHPSSVSGLSFSESVPLSAVEKKTHGPPGLGFIPPCVHKLKPEMKMWWSNMQTWLISYTNHHSLFYPNTKMWSKKSDSLIKGLVESVVPSFLPSLPSPATGRCWAYSAHVKTLQASNHESSSPLFVMM